MFEQVLEAISAYPYLAVMVLFVLCGIGLPLPEEVLLLAAGYFCATYPDRAELPLMMAACAGGILCGDVLPYVLGRVFGVRLLRLRWLRLVVTKQRLASFDRWFRRRGDWVILIARFIPGLRVVAFFTAGTMKMAWRRFLLLDGMGIVLMVPLLTWGGYHSKAFIERAIATVQRVERGLLWTVMAGGIVLVAWFWIAQYRKRKAREAARQTDRYVQPQRPVEPSLEAQAAAAIAQPDEAGEAGPARGADAAGAALGDPPPPPPGSPVEPEAQTVAESGPQREPELPPDPAPPCESSPPPEPEPPAPRSHTPPAG